MTADRLDGTGSPAPRARIEARDLARGNGWRIAEVTCRAGPGDKPFEELHEHVSIAAVVAGTFQYRSANGTALLHPGAFLLGNAGACYECGHEHAAGDRCIAFHYAPEYFAEIAASVAGTHRFRFGAAMMPSLPKLAPVHAELEALARGASPMAFDEAAIRLAETILGAVSGIRRAGPAPSARDERRITRALRHMERHADAPLELDGLAGLACMSKYHFLRTFRRVVGVTPYRYLLDLRMRRAALRLRTTPEPVSAIAYDTGFGDLSTFNARFRAQFGASPTGFRRAAH